MKIGKVDLGERPLLLAPMEDVTDVAFRTLCKGFGADMVYTEFLSADALIRQVAGTTRKLEIDPEERPVAIQIYGREVAPMVEAARIAEAAGPEVLDLNFGCPVKRVAGKGAGSGMLRCPDLMLEIVREVVKAVNIPVTVKTRLGWDHESRIIVELAEALQDVGIQALTIHGRTRAQMYTGQADWTLIGAVKENPRMHIPIIGNGDITTGEEAKRAFDTYGVDGVMIGRGTIGQPWIFEQMKHYLTTGEELPMRAKSFYVQVLRQLVDNNIRKLDERRGILHSRRHIAASPIFKGIDNFRPVRIAMLKATTREELFAEIAHAEELLLSTGEYWVTA